MFSFVSETISSIARSLDVPGYELRALIAVVLVTALCGLVGSLVMSNRMAFFSDAMAHCSFAGITLGLLISVFVGVSPDSDQLEWLVPLIMATFGALVGTGISFVRENSGLASDTVIGVFFAGALGFAAMMMTAFPRTKRFDPERFLFGGPIAVRDFDLVMLLAVVCLTVGVLLWRYNHFVLSSLSPTLARSRGVSVALNNYLFIFLLALIVNFSITAVGVLLINAMLIVPSATASNLAGNMRQLFRWSLALSVGTGVIGLYLSFTIRIKGVAGQMGASGSIICLGVCLFAASLGLAALKRRLAHLG